MSLWLAIFDAKTRPKNYSHNEAVNMLQKKIKEYFWDFAFFKDEEDSDEEPKKQFRGRASTIGNGQIPRLARGPMIQKGTSCKKPESSDKVNEYTRSVL